MEDKNWLDYPIDKLEIEDNMLTKLVTHKIRFIKDLWQLSRKDLKRMDFSDDQINHIIIKMQLLGIDLNKKVYNKN